MNEPVYLLADFSLQRTLTLLLQTAVMYSGYPQPHIPWEKVITLKRRNQDSDLTYTSAIALQLSSQVNQPAHEIVHTLDQALQTQVDQFIHGWSILNLPLPYPAMVLAGVGIQATANGLIQFVMYDQALAAWLDSLIQTTMAQSASLSPAPIELTLQDQFQIQHTHARCCSLLRLAEHQGLIELAQQFLELDPFFWQIVEPKPFPWLTVSGRLQISDSTGQQLIQALVSAVDHLASESSLKARENGRQALAVCQAFQALHESRPLLANQTAEALPCLFVYLALVRVTQHVLSYYLRGLLNLTAPAHL